MPNEEELLKEIESLKLKINELKDHKKYGLIWEDKEEKFEKDSKDALPILKEKGGKFKDIITDKKDDFNILIEGDNYHALSVLSYTHKNKIDVIYIDPPYNIGNKDFIYNDHYVDKDDRFRHSKWLSFMEKRLKLAKALLKKEGVIFISIDDNELAQLKMLCDMIFGKENFISNNIRITTKRVKGDSEDVNKIHDYLLIYANKNHNIYHKSKENYDIYKYKDKYVKERGMYLIRPLDNGSINYSEKSDYIIKAPNGGKIVAGGDIKNREKRLKGARNKKDWCFRWSEKKLEWGIKNDFIIFKGGEGKQRVYFKIYQFVDNELNPTQKYDNCLSVMENHYNNKGTTELKDILKNHKFNYPKPLSLIKEIIVMATKGESIVLDFFAGSGTTGHAVLELNKDDVENRKFILCTNNENDICEEVTYARIKKVINGYRKNSNGEKVEGLNGNLKYLKTDFIKLEKSVDTLKSKIVEGSTEILCLKENSFDLVADTYKNNRIRIFQNKDKYTAILFDLFYFDDFVDKLKQLKDKPVSVYIFSYAKDFSKKEFGDLDIEFTIEPIPEKILETYKKIFDF